MSAEMLVCEICGTLGIDVSIGLIAWRSTADASSGEPSAPYASGPRCKDTAACRARVERSGKVWPVRESAAA